MTLVGFLLGLVVGGLSVVSLWWITGFAAKASQGLRVEDGPERPTGWDNAPTNTGWDPPRSEGGGARAEERPTGWDETPTDTRWDAPRMEGRSTDEPRSALAPPPSALRATLRLFGAFLLKAPILFAIAYGAQSLGTSALQGCVGGVVLVYFLAVFWAAARTHRR